MKILFVASECVPFFKSGGLADVIGSLPKALQELGIEVRVVLPKYQNLKEEYQNRLKTKATLSVKVGWRNQYCRIEELEFDGIHYYFIDNEYYFKRDSLYGYLDEAERFIYFSRAVLKALPYMEYRPDIIHVHDWQTAIIPTLLDAHYGGEFFYSGIKTVLTIHNLKYQGTFAKELLTDMLDLGWEYFNGDQLEFNGGISLLKGGIVSCDVLTTVSPTYALEIQDPFYGEGLDGLLRTTAHKLRGIINGIDYKEWNPSTDKYIFEKYGPRSVKKKSINKLALQKKLGLKEDPDIPLIGIVSRLVSQKGLDLVGHVLDQILAHNLQFVVLGTGESKYEDMFIQKAKESPEKVSANILFDNSLAHQIYAGSDFILMPSMFEPCGLTQLIALRYATLPIVRETGGLKDTVLSFNEYTGEGNGFSFLNYNAHDMLNTITRALSFYNKEPVWTTLRQRAIKEDNSWTLSAKAYSDLYDSLMS
ncbi:MAG: glycogen synthase GlgA [Firmicutes bacterium]|nr:glycogen synthase GlgA [Bacillota bacterium]MDD4693983.1 glycogen synthase GlgA [Bacillota bacterium]